MVTTNIKITNKLIEKGYIFLSTNSLTTFNNGIANGIDNTIESNRHRMYGVENNIRFLVFERYLLTTFILIDNSSTTKRIKRHIRKIFIPSNISLKA